MPDAFFLSSSPLPACLPAYRPVFLVCSSFCLCPNRCGMSKEGTERAARQHDDWMVNGRYGCIQLFDPALD